MMKVDINLHVKFKSTLDSLLVYVGQFIDACERLLSTREA